VLTAVEHYARSPAQLAGHVREPGWAPTLQPATACVRTNLDALRQMLHGRQIGQVSSAEDLIDAAEAYAAESPTQTAALPCSPRLGRYAVSTKWSSSSRPTSATLARRCSHKTYQQHFLRMTVLAV
jgi:hypothetical protein